ncbi:hypothetical protein F4677DRAFT_432899 [Hypoxylon crocopeplum]|nr:hypothetical protein F4677DRAFT_432899 [Hypoxylon crocopeplum]
MSSGTYSPAHMPNIQWARNSTLTYRDPNFNTGRSQPVYAEPMDESESYESYESFHGTDEYYWGEEDTDFSSETSYVPDPCAYTPPSSSRYAPERGVKTSNTAAKVDSSVATQEAKRLYKPNTAVIRHDADEKSKRRKTVRFAKTYEIIEPEPPIEPEEKTPRQPEEKEHHRRRHDEARPRESRAHEGRNTVEAELDETIKWLESEQDKDRQHSSRVSHRGEDTGRESRRSHRVDRNHHHRHSLPRSAAEDKASHRGSRSHSRWRLESDEDSKEPRRHHEQRPEEPPIRPRVPTPPSPLPSTMYGRSNRHSYAERPPRRAATPFEQSRRAATPFEQSRHTATPVEQSRPTATPVQRKRRDSMAAGLKALDQDYGPVRKRGENEMGSTIVEVHREYPLPPRDSHRGHPLSPRDGHREYTSSPRDSPREYPSPPRESHRARRAEAREAGEDFMKVPGKKRVSIFKKLFA